MPPRPHHVRVMTLKDKVAVIKAAKMFQEDSGISMSKTLRTTLRERETMAKPTPKGSVGSATFRVPGIRDRA